MKPRLLLCCLLLFFLTSFAAARAQPASPPAAAPDGAYALILASPQDPYYPLAEEIARAEALLIAHTLPEALAQKPTFLLWVVSPSHLSDQALADFGRALNAQDAAVSLGLITGRKQQEARSLWQRGAQVGGGKIFAANGLYPAAGVQQGRILAFDGGLPMLTALTRPALQQALQEAGYLTFTGHGSSGYWKLDEETRMLAGDLPTLPATVIGTASCQTFRLWAPDSIALAFSGQGAAAYAGFVFSPNEGYLIGEFDGLPFRYTWPGFPLGYAVLVQNRGTLQGFARFPYYFLLGDPRLSLQDSPPYEPVEDRQSGETRLLRYSAAPRGIIPVLIPGGAAYSFVEIPGTASAWERDPFYNARLQMADIGGDKAILFDHPGGEFALRLHLRPPWFYPAADLISDSLDHTLVYLPGTTGGDLIALLFSLPLLLGTAWYGFRRRLALQAFAPSLVIAALFAAINAAYLLARQGEVTITSKPVEIHWLSVLGTFLLAGTGSFLFSSAPSRLGRALAVLTASSPALAPAVFTFTVISIFNQVYARPALGTGIYNYVPAQMALIAFLIEAALYWPVFSLLRNRPVQAGQAMKAARLFGLRIKT